MKSRTLYMGTTKIDSGKTAAEVMQVLVASGARQIASDYDAKGKITGLRFCIQRPTGESLLFALPVRIEPLLKHLRNDRSQAERVAWRQLLRWVQAQLAMIEVGMVAAEEVYTPYLLASSGVTLFESMQTTKFKLLEAGR